MSFSWSVPPSRAWPEMSDAYTQAIRRGVLTIANRYAPQIEAWMKVNAPWQDQTGFARNALRGEVEEMGLDMVSVIVSHGAEYGIFLETRHAGRYAILAPAVDIYGPQIWNDVRALVGR